MKNGLYFAMFIAGATVGSAATWCYVKKKYEKIAQEEIDSVKAVFARKEGYSQAKETIKEEEGVNKGFSDGIRMAANQAKEKPDIAEYAAMIHKYGGSIGEDEKSTKGKYPYVIPPEEFGEFEDYEKISLTYYADGILADDNDEIVDDVESIVGDALNHFGEYEDDSVFVRCDERKCDYEILLDQRSFSEVAGSKPSQVEA
ncbi:hypothetical protein [uncultured Phocaeicola sp.]|uniref:hypothetical protein n=1 Tax=uncultured Phocaeicola sp. TaxID=990718 RepID=UPI00262A4C88|nr:hypothetical protein [uncultured Phocaeicola sp.]